MADEAEGRDNDLHEKQARGEAGPGKRHIRRATHESAQREATPQDEPQQEQRNEPHEGTPTPTPTRGALRPSEAVEESEHPTGYKLAITEKDKARHAKYARRRAANPTE
jgi:hypothetical protein